MEIPIITARLIITTFDLSMAESVHENSIDEDNILFLPDEVFDTVDKARATITELISFYGRKDAPLVYPIMLKSGPHIGHIEAVPIDLGWEIGYHIGKKYTNQGYATEALQAFLPEIMEELGIDHIYGICRGDNNASHKVLEKSGFQLQFSGVAPYHGDEYPIRRYLYQTKP